MNRPNELFAQSFSTYTEFLLWAGPRSGLEVWWPQVQPAARATPLNTAGHVTVCSQRLVQEQAGSEISRLKALAAA